MILRMVSLRAWWTKGVAVAFMYCSISVLASVVALNNVVASSVNIAQAERVMQVYLQMAVDPVNPLKPCKTLQTESV